MSLAAKAVRTGAVVVALAVSGGAGTRSDPVIVDNDARNVHWTTAFTNAVPLVWDWDAEATHARLEIAGMNGSFATNFTSFVSNYLWRAFVSDVPSVEDVYTLTLTFYTNDSAVIGALTSQLAVVSGAFGATPVNTVSNSAAWPKVKANVVIPYDAGFAAATHAVSSQLVVAKRDGAAQTNAFANAAGYYGWKIVNGGWGYGTFDLALTFPGTDAGSLTAELVRPLEGTAVSVR